MTRALREAAAKSGKLPHELMLMVARGQKLPGDKTAPTRAERLDMMKACAPYYAPRLLAATVRHPAGEGNPYAEILAAVQGSSRGLPAEVSKRVRGT